MPTITRIEAIPVSAPIRRPLKMAVATVYVRTAIVVIIEDSDGASGLGSCIITHYFTGESHASAMDLIMNQFAPVLVGMDSEDIDAIRALMRKIVVHNEGTRAAVEMALHDMAAKKAGLPLYQYWGGRKRESVPTIWHVSGSDAQDMADDAAKAVAEGYPLIKVKVGKEVESDIVATQIVRTAIGDDILLLPDANQGFNVEDAIRYCTAVAELNPGFVEQPVPHDNILGMQEVAKASPVIIAGDEGIFNAQDLRTYVGLGAAGAAVAKLMKAAGPTGTKEVFEAADEAGIGVHFAGMAGQTSISAAHGAHLGLAMENLEFGSGISPQYLSDDIVTERFLPIAGHFYPSDEPGVGLELDHDKLEHFRVDR